MWVYSSTMNCSTTGCPTSNRDKLLPQSGSLSILKQTTYHYLVTFFLYKLVYFSTPDGTTHWKFWKTRFLKPLVQSIHTCQTQFLHIIPNHFRPGLPWPPSWPYTLHLHIHAFPYPILLIFPLHMTKQPQPVFSSPQVVSLQNITNCPSYRSALHYWNKFYKKMDGKRLFSEN